MTDIVERLRAHGDQFPIKNSAEWVDFASLYLVEAAKTIEILRVELAKVNMENGRLTRTNRAKREHRDKLLQTTAKQADEIDRLRAVLRDIAKTTYGYEPYMTEEEGMKYFSSQFFGAQAKARAALGEKG